MAKSFTGRKRIRIDFGRIPSAVPMPNLIEMQKTSYDRVPADRTWRPRTRTPSGLQEVFKSVFPIKDFSDRGHARIRQVRARGAEVRRRGMPAARPDLRRAAQGDAASRRLGRRRGHRRPLDPRHQGAGRLHGRHAAHDVERHLHRQRHRARHRLPDAPFAGRVLRPRQGQDPFVGQVPVRRAHHSLSRLVARLRVRRQGPGLRAHRPPPQAAGDDAADGARQRRRPPSCAPSARRRGEPFKPEDAVGMSAEEILALLLRHGVVHLDRARAGRRRSIPRACAASSWRPT